MLYTYYTLYNFMRLSIQGVPPRFCFSLMKKSSFVRLSWATIFMNATIYAITTGRYIYTNNICSNMFVHKHMFIYVYFMVTYAHVYLFPYAHFHRGVYVPFAHVYLCAHVSLIMYVQ